MSDTALLLFARPPVEGRVKTRLIPAIGARKALAVYRFCLDHALSLARDSGFDHQLWLSEADDTGELADETVRLQQGDNLGQRMHHALEQALKNHPRVILIGSDCLDLDLTILRRVEQELINRDMVFIPAEDGGYVLIAARQRIDPLIFADIPWGSDAVMATTRQRIAALKLNVGLLDSLRDIDRADDLQHYPELQPHL